MNRDRQSDGLARRLMAFCWGAALGAVLCAAVLHYPAVEAILMPLVFALAYVILFGAFSLVRRDRYWRARLADAWRRPLSGGQAALIVVGTVLLIFGYALSPLHGFKIGLLLMGLGGGLIAAANS